MRMWILAMAILVMAGASMPTLAGAAQTEESSSESAKEVRCPVMGSVVKDPSTAQHSEYKGHTYYFCCAGCKPLFDANPEKYVGKQK